eukprot:TRINITY_DN187_c4_g1_i1.p1 TRINITY_DN187_c4_g1~~TRINITY_DN187_c4_g1_i1.p1  ORF type:complete len:349 (-),score=159.01 TRINITY_DN187_c4_g1_i1:47-1093(-)
MRTYEKIPEDFREISAWSSQIANQHDRFRQRGQELQVEFILKKIEAMNAIQVDDTNEMEARQYIGNSGEISLNIPDIVEEYQESLSNLKNRIYEFHLPKIRAEFQELRKEIEKLEISKMTSSDVSLKEKLSKIRRNIEDLCKTLEISPDFPAVTDLAKLGDEVFDEISAKFTAWVILQLEKIEAQINDPVQLEENFLDIRIRIMECKRIVDEFNLKSVDRDRIGSMMNRVEKEIRRKDHLMQDLGSRLDKLESDARSMTSQSIDAMFKEIHDLTKSFQALQDLQPAWLLQFSQSRIDDIGRSLTKNMESVSPIWDDDMEYMEDDDDDDEEDDGESDQDVEDMEDEDQN